LFPSLPCHYFLELTTVTTTHEYKSRGHCFSNLLITLITPWSRVFLKKLVGAQMGKNSQPFLKNEDLLHCSQEPITGPHPEPDKSSPQPRTLFL
jgi:hypothetical protein